MIHKIHTNLMQQSHKTQWVWENH